MAERITQFIPQSFGTGSKPVNNQPVGSRLDRLESFEQVRTRSLPSVIETPVTSRADNERQLAKLQTELQAKWEQRGLLANASAYGPDGASGSEKLIGRHVDLYA